jgi:hypothetical protein
MFLLDWVTSGRFSLEARRVMASTIAEFANVVEPSEARVVLGHLIDAYASEHLSRESFPMLGQALIILARALPAFTQDDLQALVRWIDGSRREIGTAGVWCAERALSIIAAKSLTAKSALPFLKELLHTEPAHQSTVAALVRGVPELTLVQTGSRPDGAPELAAVERATLTLDRDLIAPPARLRELLAVLPWDEAWARACSACPALAALSHVPTPDADAIIRRITGARLGITPRPNVAALSILQAVEAVAAHLLSPDAEERKPRCLIEVDRPRRLIRRIDTGQVLSGALDLVLAYTEALIAKGGQPVVTRVFLDEFKEEYHVEHEDHDLKYAAALLRKVFGDDILEEVRGRRGGRKLSARVFGA